MASSGAVLEEMPGDEHAGPSAQSFSGRGSECPAYRLDDLEVLRELGRGAYGQVFKVRSKIDGGLYVLKKIVMRHLNSQQQRECVAEVANMRVLRHANIIHYYNSFVEDQTLYIVMEYAEGGDLQQALNRQLASQRVFDERDLWRYLFELLCAVQHLHLKNIVHRDLKSLNVFLTKDNHVKVGDLGVSRLLNSIEAQMETRVGTPLYLSPEVIKHKTYDAKVDEWSVGIILYTLSALRPPFQGENLFALANAIASQRPKSLPRFYSRPFTNTVMWLLEKNPLDRPSADRVLESMPAAVRRHFERGGHDPLPVEIVRALAASEDGGGLSTLYPGDPFAAAAAPAAIPGTRRPLSAAAARRPSGAVGVGRPRPTTAALRRSEGSEEPAAGPARTSGQPPLAPRPITVRQFCAPTHRPSTAEDPAPAQPTPPPPPPVPAPASPALDPSAPDPPSPLRPAPAPRPAFGEIAGPRIPSPVSPGLFARLPPAQYPPSLGGNSASASPVAGARSASPAAPPPIANRPPSARPGVVAAPQSVRRALATAAAPVPPSAAQLSGDLQLESIRSVAPPTPPVPALGAPAPRRLVNPLPHGNVPLRGFSSFSVASTAPPDPGLPLTRTHSQPVAIEVGPPTDRSGQSTRRVRPTIHDLQSSGRFPDLTQELQSTLAIGGS